MKIAIAHFRIGLTDGVSLQIEERVNILRKLGHEIVFIAGSNSPTVDLRIPHFDYKDNPEINAPDKLKVNTEEIGKSLEQYWEKEKFTHIFIHNLFSLPVCIPASVAFYDFLKNHPSVKGVAVHHDFWWDPPRINKFKIKSSKLKVIFAKYLPPLLPNLLHTVISKWEQRELETRMNIDSEVITDTFDFEQPAWLKNDNNKNFIKDAGLSGKEMKILLASRIRPRKGIEIGIEFVANLANLLHQDQPERKNTVLLLPNDYFAPENEYVEKLKYLARQFKVEIRWIQDLVGSEAEKSKGDKKYSLWDCYVFADAVVYPSLWEGFGNQFLEAVFAKKPVVVFEYPVFKTDIAIAGFKVISLGDKSELNEKGLAVVQPKFLLNAAKDLLDLTHDPEKLIKITETNYQIGRKKFNTKTQLKNHLEKMLKKKV